MIRRTTVEASPSMNTVPSPEPIAYAVGAADALWVVAGVFSRRAPAAPGAGSAGAQRRAVAPIPAHVLVALPGALAHDAIVLLRPHGLSDGGDSDTGRIRGPRR
jgi:hypothetical protein